jgi:ABC-type multidrug transport system ATPase subunit
MLRVSDLRVTVGGADLVSGVSLVVPDGGRLAVLGRSGAGKTSLLRAIAGHLPIAGGTVEHQPASGAQRVVFVPQEPTLFAALTVVENIAVFRRSAGLPSEETSTVTTQLLEGFELTQLAAKLCGEISGGEQQRVALARAAAVVPSLLLVDEPTARQDAGHRSFVTDALTRATAGSVLVIATHDPEVAAICHDVLTLDNPGAS